MSMTEDREFLTVKELAELLRLKERKVYDLAANGQVPCTRATGKLLFPAAEIRVWLNAATGGGAAPAPAPNRDLPPILLGSHDPLLDWALRHSRCGLASYFDGSLDGLDRFLKGEGVAAGLHIYDGAEDAWNWPAVARAAGGRDAVLIAFAKRRRGLVYRSGEEPPKRLGDLTGRRLAPRQQGSGTDQLLRELARREGIDVDTLPVGEIARTEDDAVQMVQRGVADVAFGLEAVARSHGLLFSPVITEDFALIVDRKAWFDPPLQTFAAFCQSASFQDQSAALAGYDTAGFGEVIWNA